MLRFAGEGRDGERRKAETGREGARRKEGREEGSEGGGGRAGRREGGRAGGRAGGREEGRHVVRIRSGTTPRWAELTVRGGTSTRARNQRRLLRGAFLTTRTGQWATHTCAQWQAFLHSTGRHACKNKNRSISNPRTHTVTGCTISQSTLTLYDVLEHPTITSSYVPAASGATFMPARIK